MCFDDSCVFEKHVISTLSVLGGIESAYRTLHRGISDSGVLDEDGNAKALRP